MDLIESTYRDDQREQLKSELIDPRDNTGAPMRTLPTAIKTGNQFTTAMVVQQPRSLKVVNDRLEKEAHLAGEEFFYSWEVGNKNNDSGSDKVEGPSVKLAMAALRCYGNCVLDTDPIQEMSDAWIFTAAFVDLETGCTIKRQFRMDKSFPVYGKMDQYRKADVRFQIGTSKATRNVILASLPAGLIKNAMAAAHDAVREKLVVFIRKANKAAGKHQDDQFGVTEAAKSIIAMLNKKYGVTEAVVCAKYGVPKIDGLGLDEIIVMRADYVAINSGQASVEELFPMENAKTQTENHDMQQRLREAKEKAANAKTLDAKTPKPEEPKPEADKPDTGKRKKKAKADTVPGPETQKPETQKQEQPETANEPQPEENEEDEEELPPLLPTYVQQAALEGNNAASDSDVDTIDNKYRDQIRNEKDLDIWIEWIDWLRREVERRNAVTDKSTDKSPASEAPGDTKPDETKPSGSKSGPAKQGEIFE